MFNPQVIARGVKSDFANPAIAAFAPNAARIAYGTAGFRTVGAALPPVAYRCVFVSFCRSLAARLSTSVYNPVDNHRFVIDPSTIGDCGMMITASHNPAPDNGLKMVDPDGGMLIMEWESDATEVANTREASAFGQQLVTFAKRYLVMGISGPTEAAEEAPLFKLLRERPVRIHVGRDTRSSGIAILSSIKAAAATINATFGPIVFGTTSCPPVIVLEDHGVITTPTLHAMVYWNRHHHVLPVEELKLAEPPYGVSSMRERSSVSSSGENTPRVRSFSQSQLGAGAGGGGGIGSASVLSSSGSMMNLKRSQNNGQAMIINATFDIPTLCGGNFSNVAAAANDGNGNAAGSSGAGGGNNIGPLDDATISKSLNAAFSTPITPSFNSRLIFRSFVTLWLQLGLSPNPAAVDKKTVVIDCSNGVGSVTMKDALALRIHTLPSERPFLPRNAQHTNITSPSVTIGELLEAVTGVRFVLVHDAVADTSLLNKDCGADHCQKTRVPSNVFNKELAKFVSSHKEELLRECSTPNAANQTPTEAFCTAVGKRISFYCFDGDADRVVAFAPCPTKKAAADNNLDSLLKNTHFELLDGDRIAVLLASLVRDALRRPSPNGKTHPTPQPQMGVVQTAYANGASTNFILKKLHIPTVCAATGVKYLHPKAEAMEVGIYFEANGHGTLLSAASLFSNAVTLDRSERDREGRRSRSGSSCGAAGGVLGAGSVLPPGVSKNYSTNVPPTVTSATTASAAAAAAMSASNNSPPTDDSANHCAGADRTIVPSLWLGSSSTPCPNNGLKNLLLLRYLLSQCCGDAIADMLGCELALATLGWTPFYWQSMYSDLPSITGKTTVADPSVIKNTPDQRHATHPIGLQARIDAIIAEVGGEGVLARSFVRPSGTEPIVRVYAEAASAEIAQLLFNKVAEAVQTFCK